MKPPRPRSDEDEDPPPLSTGPAVGSIQQLSDKPRRGKKARPIGFTARHQEDED